MLKISNSAFSHLPRRCSDGSVSNMLSEGENSSTSIVKESSRTRPYYFRRCRRVRSTIESLPDDVLFHNLVRLPADHLCDRVRLVCRRWYRIIHSHAFINTQVQHSTYGLLLSLHTVFCSAQPIFVSATQGIEMARMSYKGRNMLCCSCNGLGILYLRRMNDNHMLHIINPATKQLFVLPPVSSTEVFFYNAGMAYAAASMENKVIVQYQFPKDFFGILTVGVDNSWRHPPVESLPSHARKLLSQFPLSTEGFIHWARDLDVLTLDVETEVFTVSVVPLQSSHAFFSLIGIRTRYLPTGRYLSMLVSLRDFVFEVWVMEPESGEWRKPLPDINLEAQKCKLKRFARGLKEPVLLLLGWVKYPEVLAMYFWGEGKETKICIFYNLNTLEISSIELPDTCSSYMSVAHKNNLMWLT